MGRKTILFLAPSAYTLGGLADWLDYLLPGLNERGWECVLGLVHGRHHDVDAYLARHPWPHTVRVENPTGSREGRLSALASAITQIQPDVLANVNIADAYEAIRRLRVAAKPATRFIATLHGLQGDLLEDLRENADVVDAVVATNRLAAKLAGIAIRSEDKAWYASCGVSIHEIRPASRQLKNRMRLLYSGRFEADQKRVLDLPDLMKNLIDLGVEVQLSLAGGGPEEGALRDKFSRLGLDEQVSYLGVLDPSRLGQAYREHDALVIASVWETGPIAPWEAMSYGLPVLSSRYLGSGAEGALADGVNCLLFPVGDMQAAARSAQRLADPELAQRISQGGLQLVKERYSQQASVDAWNKAFQQVLDLPVLDIPKSGCAVPPSGRLDRLLGVKKGEMVRRMLGVSFQHQGPGGEWPHSNHAGPNTEEFMKMAAELDKVPA